MRVALLILLVTAAQLAYAQTSPIPPRPVPPKLVNDLANVLSDAEESALERKLVDFDNQTSNQIVVVTVPSLEGREVQSFTLELAQKWKAGNEKNDNGVVVLAAIQDRKINISVGFGLEGALPDGICSRIIKNEITPAFKEGNYFEGFDKGTDAIVKATKGEYKGEQKAKKGKGGGVGAIIFIIIIIIVAVTRGGGNNRGGRYMSRGGVGDIATGMLLGSLLGGRGGGSSWGGGDSGGSGGFGGFGGGDFGGGGASGGW